MDDSNSGTWDPFAKSKEKPKGRPMGGIGFFDDLELGDMISDAPVEIAKIGADIFSAVTDLFKTDIIGGGENKEKKPGMDIGGKTEIDFKKQQEGYRKKDFYQKIEADRREDDHQNLEQVMDDLVRLEVGAMSTDQKNKELHLSADLDEKNIRDPYHLHALRVKKMEMIKAAVQNQKDASLAAAGGSNLNMRLDANEGQSMVSQSGAIMSAG